jgi:hypothetical protein
MHGRTASSAGRGFDLTDSMMERWSFLDEVTSIARPTAANLDERDLRRIRSPRGTIGAIGIAPAGRRRRHDRRSSNLLVPRGRQVDRVRTRRAGDRLLAGHLLGSARAVAAVTTGGCGARATAEQSGSRQRQSPTDGRTYHVRLRDLGSPSRLSSGSRTPRSTGRRTTGDVGTQALRPPVSAGLLAISFLDQDTGFVGLPARAGAIQDTSGGSSWNPIAAGLASFMSDALD